MSWRLALALSQLRDEVNLRAPNRSIASDGTIGDPAHASRTSDHNPNGAGVVTAWDCTDDPPRHDATSFAEWLRQTRDPRIKYVIDDQGDGTGDMFSSYATSTRKAWTWGPYTGINTHSRHTHVSVVTNPDLYDLERPWGWADVRGVGMDAISFVTKGDKGPAVRYWQRRMNRAVPQAQRVVDDGDYGTSTGRLVALIAGSDGSQIGAVQADRIEHAVDVRNMRRATANQADALDLSELAKEVAQELTVTVRRKQ